jgi:adenine phosphoribosyltransferase
MATGDLSLAKNEMAASKPLEAGIGPMVESIVRMEAVRPSAPVALYTAQVGKQTIELPVMQMKRDLAIALLMTIDVDLQFVEEAGIELAETLRRLEPQVVVTAATLGIPVGAAVAKALGLRRQYVLQKTDKAHLADALTEPLTSTTTEARQHLRLDRRWLPAIAGKRVVFVDDVISSGSSCAAALRLLRAAGAHVVGIGCFLVEGDGWKKSMSDEDAELVQTLGRVPVFHPSSEKEGEWKEDWAC